MVLCSTMITITIIIMYIYSNHYNGTSFHTPNRWEHGLLTTIEDSHLTLKTIIYLVVTPYSMNPAFKHKVELQSKYLEYYVRFKNVCNYCNHLNLQNSSYTVAIIALTQYLTPYKYIILGSFYPSQVFMLCHVLWQFWIFLWLWVDWWDWWQ